MATNAWVRGQRWVSDSEPELGLGIILNGGDGKVEIAFPAAAETRCYALESAPLRRVKFRAGDRIRTHEGTELTVDQVRETEGLRVYQTSAGDVAEAELADSISFSKPEERLFGGKIDDPSDFDLRGEALRRRAEMRRSPIRGLVGARVDLIPHQLFIADEVSNRPLPRVLLADEVGLGKTIEACLILHRLVLTGRVQRALVLVPEPLIHQWFVELLRRFQLCFELFDESRCEAIESGDPDGNPFLDSQWVLAPVEFLAANPRRTAQAREAGWDILIVDEAHHLEWSPGSPGAAYTAVASLAAETEGLLLLTATPQQLGPEGHFARLQLLDPERYADLARYEEETRHYEEVAEVIEGLSAGNPPNNRLMRLVSGRPRLLKSTADLAGGKPEARERLIADLLDSVGIGRVMFRNTRARLGGFPGREPKFAKLKGKDDFSAKIEWLGTLLEKLGEEKVLVITRSREMAEALLESLRDKTGLVGALFHEVLSLIQRDRNAAFFAEPDGARVLISSEIGSEGRNFQFARHLVLFDLPEDVDLLEQRIGRLDRIGQKGTIEIHVPYPTGSADEVRVTWLEEGLDAFRKSPAGAAEIQREVQPLLSKALAKPGKAAVTKLLAETQACRSRIAERLARGQDRLLERSSNRQEKAAELVTAIRAWDNDADFEDFVIRLFDHSGLHIEELGSRRYFLLPGNLKSDAFPSLPNEGITITLDRQRALEREQEAFLTWDHPMVRAALDLLLGAESGNAAFGLWDSSGEKRMLLEAWIIVECVAPAQLHAELFLPQTPIRVVVDHSGKDHSDDRGIASAKLRRGDPAALLKNEKVKRTVLPAMLDRVREIGNGKSTGVIESALAAMQAELSGEISRLQELAEINDHVSPAEITALESRKDQLAQVICNARVRVDAVRLIWKAPISDR